MYKVLGIDQKEYGPVTVEQIEQWIAEGRLTGHSLVRLDGMTGWKALSQFPEFTPALGRQAPQVASAPYFGPMRAPPRANGLAVTSLVMGILSWFCCGLGIFSILGIVFGVMALSQLKNNPSQSGRVLAIVGLVLSSLSVVMFILGLASGFFKGILEALGIEQRFRGR